MQNYLILILLVILTIHHHPLSVDVNECELNMDDCSDLAICSNTVGGFTCSCLVGYSGNGRECVSELCKIILLWTLDLTHTSKQKSTLILNCLIKSSI